VEEICRSGGNAAVLDLNEELGAEVIKRLPDGAGKFFPCDVSETESIAAAVKGVAEWTKQTGRPMGGVIPAAGVGNPSTVRGSHCKPSSRIVRLTEYTDNK
jgi:3-hydroxyacyl-CoA dehydrogenase / 3-hydroxy-2-methylbutyryl-CoA dehydrogenase